MRYIMDSEKSFVSKLNIKLQLFLYSYEYQILILASIFSGLLIVYIANKYFIYTSYYYYLLIFGIIVSGLGFVLENIIKHFKKKAIETSFNYFLQDLSREYKVTNNISLALININKANAYGSIDSEIKRIANRVSWGDDFENALLSVNETIKSPIIDHTLVLLHTFKDSSIPLDKVIFNISKDLTVFKEETQKKKYFLNLYYLSIVLFFVFLFVILFVNILLGTNFLWYGNEELVTRIFFDNFLLYISILLGMFTAFIMYSIKEENNFNFIKYVFIFFIITLLLFQVVVPKPDAENVLIDTLTYMNANNLNDISIDSIIALKSISSKYILDKTYSDTLYFVPMDEKDCGLVCAEYVIFIPDAVFLNFEIMKNETNFVIAYKFI